VKVKYPHPDLHQQHAHSVHRQAQRKHPSRQHWKHADHQQLQHLERDWPSSPHQQVLVLPLERALDLHGLVDDVVAEAEQEQEEVGRDELSPEDCGGAEDQAGQRQCHLHEGDHLGQHLVDYLAARGQQQGQDHCQLRDQQHRGDCHGVVAVRGEVQQEESANLVDVGHFWTCAEGGVH